VRVCAYTCVSVHVTIVIVSKTNDRQNIIYKWLGMFGNSLCPRRTAWIVS